MNKKNIKRNIQNKINDWLESIKDPELVKELNDNIIVTGGCIPSMLLNEKVNDYDIYIKSVKVLEKLAKYYCSELVDKIEIKDDRVKIFISSDGIIEIEKEDDKKYQVLFISENAISLSEDIQIITRFSGSPKEIHKNFDFVHCTHYYETKDRNIIYSKLGLSSILEKQLYYQGSLFPVCSIIRLRKFIKRGWYISAGEIFKILFQVSKLDLTDVEVLKEQLTGVDSSYFNILIDNIEENQDLSYDYVCELIDQLFNEQ